MNEYSLQIQIEQEDIIDINKANLKIAVARMFGKKYSLVWLVLLPFENNLIKWTNEFGLYMSLGDIAQEAIQINSSLSSPIETGKAYSFTNVFTKEQEECSATVKIQNLANEMMVFGLTQNATINTKKTLDSIINCEYIMPNMYSSYIPSKSVCIWLQTDISEGVPVFNSFSKTTVVDFEGSVFNRTCVFDSSKGVFVLAD